MMDKVKSLGQVFTPLEVVEQILDEVGFTIGGINRASKILEPSFGEGVFIKAIIKRVYDSFNNGSISKKELSDIVDDIVWGVEYDADLFKEALFNLKAWAKKEFALDLSLRNLYRMDALDFKNFNSFDFVVGNPPYVRIHNMDEDMRKKVKEYAHSTGTTDLYIIFYELGIKWLKSNGVLGYIAPNSWMKNSSQAGFRKELIDSKFLKKIIDFGTRPDIFPTVSTYTCITIIDKNANHTKMTFSYKGEKEHYDVNVDIGHLAENPNAQLSFSNNEDYSFLKELKKNKTKKLGELCSIQNGLATLGDKLYLYNESRIKSENAESTLLLPIVKASRYKGGKIVDKFMFPYKVDSSGRVEGMLENDFKTSAPNIYKAFTKIKNDLMKRSLDKNSLWFWYGRSQALQSTYKEKLVFSPLVGPEQDTISSYIVPAGTLVYSGLFIIENDSHTKLADIKKIIESKDFCKYAKLSGKDMSGGYKSMNSQLVKEFMAR